MPSISEGLETGAAPPLDPFAAALEAKGVMDGGDSATLSVADGLTTGRTPTPTEPVEETDTSDAGTDTDDEGDTDGEDTPLHEDPEVAALLARYDGDTEKALKAAAEAQKLIGRQGNELGELRSQISELKGAVDTLKTVAPAAPPAQQIQLGSDQIQEMIDENGGLAASTWAANNAPHLVNNFLRAWQQEDPIGALDFRDEWKAWQAQQAEAAKPAPEPSKAELRAERDERSEALGAAMVQIAKEFEDYDEFKEFIPAALEQSPKVIAKAIASGEADDQLEALREVYERAQRLSASEARKQAEADAKAAAKARGTASKSAARVIQSSSGTPATPKQQGDNAGSQDDVISAFKATILAADSTSVADGLTYGKS